MENVNDELEFFRRQWREEVSARSKPKLPSSNLEPPDPSPVEPSSRPPIRHAAADRDEDEEDIPVAQNYGEVVERVRTMDVGPREEDAFDSRPQKEPSSALEHFEQAAEKEAQGSLGDSLSLYRKAYRVYCTW
jgi:F-box protein 9